MIYGRFGHKLTIERIATLDDIKPLTGRKPDKRDREAIANGSYVVVKYVDDGKKDLYHQAFLKADGGAQEIGAVIDHLAQGHKKGGPIES